MFDVVFTAGDLEQLTVTQLDAVIDFCRELEFQYGVDMRETISLVKERQQQLLELAWSDTSPRIWA